MFKAISEELRTYLGGLMEFMSVMQRDDKLFLFPIVASIENTLPLSTYVLSERTPYTKDRSQINITLNFWFNIESYDQCCDFTDTMSELIDAKYLFQSSAIEYNEESETFSGIINFSII